MPEAAARMAHEIEQHSLACGPRLVVGPDLSKATYRHLDDAQILRGRSASVPGDEEVSQLAVVAFMNDPPARCQVHHFAVLHCLVMAAKHAEIGAAHRHGRTCQLGAARKRYDFPLLPFREIEGGIAAFLAE